MFYIYLATQVLTYNICYKSAREISTMESNFVTLILHTFLCESSLDYPCPNSSVIMLISFSIYGSAKPGSKC